MTSCDFVRYALVMLAGSRFFFFLYFIVTVYLPNARVLTGGNTDIKYIHHNQL